MWSKRVDPIDELTVARSLRTEPGFAWLDSNRSESKEGRFSFLTAWPRDEVRVDFGTPRPFDALARISPSASDSSAGNLAPSDVPSWIGYIAYDAFWSEPARGHARFDRAAEPVVFFRRYPAVFALDHQTGQTWVVGDDQSSCERFVAQVEGSAASDWDIPTIGEVRVDDPKTHRDAIVSALEYIGEGEVYEVNLARRWSAPFEGDPLGLWRAMRLASRVPLGMFFDAGDHAVLACTMERFIHWDAVGRGLVMRRTFIVARRVAHQGDHPARTYRRRSFGPAARRPEGARRAFDDRRPDAK